ncbi:MAG: fibronectin type III domain-containing protein [Bacteroidales bacterium]|nr:fibronectin type III domain-containing protein [Bacteroidales bacterium]
MKFVLRFFSAFLLMFVMAWSSCAQTVVLDDQNPFNEDFEGTDLSGWTQDTLVGARYWELSTTNAVSGTQSVKFGGASSTNETMLISPLFDVSAMTGAVKLSFSHLQNASLSAVEVHVYYRTDTNMAWTLLESYTTSVTEFTRDSLYLPLNLTTCQIGFKGVDKFLNFNGAYLDDITISSEVNCLEPIRISVGDIASDMATVYWSQQGTETRWNIQYGPAGFALGNGTSVVQNTYPFCQLNNLTPDTQYEVYVQSDCIGNQSGWVGPVAFHTPCNQITVTESQPYSEDFSGYTAVGTISEAGVAPSCWEMMYSGSTENYDPKVFNGSYTPNAGNNALEITSGTSTFMGFIPLAVAGTSNYAVMPEFSNALDELQVMFSTAMSTDTAGVLTLGYFADINDLSSFTVLTSIPSNNYSTNRRADHLLDLSSFPAAVGTHARLAFCWTDASTTATSTCCIDDIVVRIALDCMEPANVSATNITSQSASINWVVQDPSQNQWEVECNGIRTLTNTHPCTVSNLTPATQYTARVRSVCGANDTSYWSAPVTFLTSCPVIVVDDNNAYTEGFEDNNALGCWQGEVISGSDEWQISQSSANNGFSSLSYSSSVFGDMTDILSFFGGMADFGNGSAQIISPVFDISNVTNPRLNFYRRQVSLMIPQTLYVYYRTSPTANWNLLQSCTTSTSWSLESLPLPNPSATYQIAFLGLMDINNMGTNFDPFSMGEDDLESFASNIYIDDIRIGMSEECDDPTSVTVSSITTTTAAVNWQANGASAWIVEYGPAGFTIGNGTQMQVGVNSCQLTGLTPGTAYDVYVRADCGNGNVSNWTSASSFSTTPEVGVADYGTSALAVYPNPTTGVVILRLDATCTTGQWQVFDLCGKCLWEKNVEGHLLELDLSEWPSGIYYVRMVSSEKVVAHAKIIKQ